MPLRVYNTLSKEAELFVSMQPKVVRIYSCGLTVYAAMHIGHARTYCFWDLFRRYLEYRGYHVISVINYTDIDDRIMKEAGGLAGSVDVAERNIAGFRRDCTKLRIKDYAAYTRATDFIPEQVDMIDQLLAKRHAYAVNGEVFYDIRSYEKYGQLSGRCLDDQEAGASGRITEDLARKRHPADFTLWKPSDATEPAWATDHATWPKGRPGWHIECSAMSTALLGSHFDVHGGGVDNMFPHHENEIAQSEPLCGAPWVRYWLHPEHLDLRGIKMSKSLGNVIGIGDLLERHSHDEVRWFYASQHYRSKLPFSWDLLAQGVAGYARVKRLVTVLAEQIGDASDLELPKGLYASQREGDDAVPRMRHHYESGRFATTTKVFIDRFIEAMDDDINTPNALAAFFEYVNALYAQGIERENEKRSLLAVYRCLARHLAVFGIEIGDARLDPDTTADYAVRLEAATSNGGDKVVDRLIALRGQARKNKEFAKSDAIRDLLLEAGVKLEDTPNGVRWSVI
jgi:cysteinyl-tRNA synthetase